MAQGQFTVEEADNAVECVKAIIDAVPKSKRAGILGEANDLFLFLDAAKKAAKTLQEAKEEEGELEDRNLEQVAGGKGAHTIGASSTLARALVVSGMRREAIRAAGAGPGTPGGGKRSLLAAPSSKARGRVRGWHLPVTNAPDPVIQW